MTRRIGTRSRSVIRRHSPCGCAAPPASSWPLDELRKTRVISAGAEQHREPDAERGRDQHVDVDVAVAARDEHHRDRRDHDRQQREQPEDPPEAAHHRMARARDGIGLRARLPFGRAKWDYQARQAASPGGAAMTIAAVLRARAARSRRSPPTQRLADAVARLGERRIGALPVVEDGRIAGIMSERDVIYCLRDHGAEVLDWPVGRVMTSPAITVDPRQRRAGRAGADDPAADSPFAGGRRRASCAGSCRSATW